MPRGLCSRALLLDDVAEIGVTVVLEMVMDRVMDGWEFMQGSMSLKLVIGPLVIEWLV